MIGKVFSGSRCLVSQQRNRSEMAFFKRPPEARSAAMRAIGKRRLIVSLSAVILVAGSIFTAAARDVVRRQAVDDQALDTLEARRAWAMKSFLRPPEARDCAGKAHNCNWPELLHAIAVLSGSPSPAETTTADEELREIALRLPSSPGWRRILDPADSSSEARARPGQDFFALTSTLLFRAVKAFGPGRNGEASKLSAQTINAITSTFWEWGRAECKLTDADPEQMWVPRATENHEALWVQTCWATAELAAKDVTFRWQTYADGSSPAAQLEAWTRFLKTFIVARAAAGVSVEFFSPTYSRYFISPFYNVRDFSSDEGLRRDAENFLTLWWALWAQEQIGGVHGGSEARAYPAAVRHGDPASGLGWVYFGLGSKIGLTQPAVLPILLSTYQPPAIVSAIAQHQGQTGDFEVWTHQLGVWGTPSKDGERRLANSVGSLVRYAFVGRDFVAGSAMAQRLPSDAWTTISTQNRWNGVAFADGPGKKIFALASPQGRSNYNAMSARQVKGTQFVELNPPPIGVTGGSVSLCFGRQDWIDQDKGWVFVRGKAFVAARPVSGSMGPPDKDGCRVVMDVGAPIIIHTVDSSRYRSFEAFKSDVELASLHVTPQQVDLTGDTFGGSITFFRQSDTPPVFNGKPFLPPAGWSLFSPFVRQKWGEANVELIAPDQRVLLTFH